MKLTWQLTVLQGKHIFVDSPVISVRLVFAHTNWNLGRVSRDEGQKREKEKQIERLWNRGIIRSGVLRTQHGGVIGWMVDCGKENRL